MPRLFAGIDFPDTAKRDLSRLCDGMPGARWVDPRKFHLTLRFIGEVADPAAAEIAAALGRVKAPVFALALAGVGHFRQHNLWAGIAPNPALLALQAEIEQALRQIGLPADERRYVPHVKLAASRGARECGPI